MMVTRKLKAPFLLIAAGLLFCICLPKVQAYADSPSSSPLSFGNIIADPAGEIIEIDASGGPSVPTVFTSGNSRIINGGASGRITVDADMANQTITLEFPPSVPLKSAGNPDMILDGIAARSTSSPITTSTPGPVDFHIGGLLHITAGQPGAAYSGTIQVTVTVNNP